MSERLSIHIENPQNRLINQAVELIQQGAVIIYPTDSAYALGCALGDKKAMARIRSIRQLPETHHFTLVCRDLSELANFAQVDNSTFRFLKAHTPGAYTFMLNASHEVPKRLQDAKRKTIGLRIPDHPITQAILHALNQPLVSVTLTLPGEVQPLSDPEDFPQYLENQVDMIIDGGTCGVEPTTVVDLTSGVPVLVRRGKGEIDF